MQLVYNKNGIRHYVYRDCRIVICTFASNSKYQLDIYDPKGYVIVRDTCRMFQGYAATEVELKIWIDEKLGKRKNLTDWFKE
jgi:hypothetical protein